MAVDRELLGRVLLDIEKVTHQYGWDRRPHVRMLHDRSVSAEVGDTLRSLMASIERKVGPPVWRDSYWALPMLHGAMLTDGNRPPWENLRTYAMAVAYAPAEEEGIAFLREVLAAPGVIGFVFCGEAWGKRAGAKADYRAFALGERRMEDEPDRVEVRMVYCADLDENVHIVSRVRGERPVLEHPGASFRGDISTSLRILAAVAAGTVPPIEEFDQRWPSLHDTVIEEMVNEVTEAPR